ncbi:MAG TPA: endonuclease/exonuclease/phosphatase family protein [Myxococcota bacterium]|nr:endonuclease/exonuclease/phosphatase family protein [Myxococcota bacterium]HQK50474.1 endonuclease/exonuclease/phosphatase family protein [Myxococcota bacterium]
MKTAIAILVLLGGAVGTWFLWAASSPLNRDLDRFEGADLVSLPGAPVPAPPRAIKVMSWNIAFGGGAEGQPTGIYDRDHVVRNLQDIVAAIRAVDPDVVLLQEVDREARRSGMVDQFQWLLGHAGLPHGCYVDTWDVRYVPHPGWNPSGHIGRVRSGQAILSRFPIRACRREPLPQASEAPWWYRVFALHRAIQWADLDLGNGAVLTAVNVHLEAFWPRNRERQAEILAERLARMDNGRLLLVGGDLNSVPENAPQRKDFPDEPETDFTTDRTIPLIQGVPGLREVFLDEAPEAPSEASLTFPATAPNRRLDYLFHRGFAGSTQRAVPRVMASDHRPIEAALRLPSSSQEAP